MKWYLTCHLFCPGLILLLLLLWFNTKKGEYSLSHAAEGPLLQPLQYGYRLHVSAVHKAYPAGFLLALMHPSLAGVQPPFQSVFGVQFIAPFLCFLFS